MTALSGVACVFGASFICVDIIVRLFPRGRNFRIQDSDAFLSISLSLSFGVMVCSCSNTALPIANAILAVLRIVQYVAIFEEIAGSWRIHRERSIVDHDWMFHWRRDWHSDLVSLHAPLHTAQRGRL
jgi:hypothetical protein